MTLEGEALELSFSGFFFGVFLRIARIIVSHQDP